MTILVSHADRDGRPICGTRMYTFWSGCWSNRPTCKRCQAIVAKRRAAPKRPRYRRELVTRLLNPQDPECSPDVAVLGADGKPVYRKVKVRR